MRGCVALLGAVLLGSCSSADHSSVEGVLVFDEVVALVRGDKIDSAQREIPVDGNATFVARVDEDDTDVKMTLSHAGAKNVARASIEINSEMDGEGIEIAVLDAPPGSRLTVTLETAQEFDRPGKARLRVMRYDDATKTDTRAAARLASLRAWSAATGAGLTGEDIRKSAFRNIDQALAHLESPEGDPALAAWAWLVRANLSYRQFTSHKSALTDSERAERRFAALEDSRGAGRARLMQAAALIEIAHDNAAKSPSAEEAALRAKRTLISLSSNTALSGMERARAVTFLGVLAYHVYDLSESRARFLAVLPTYEALGNQSQRLRVVGNLGALAIEEGDYRSAVQYYDQVVAELHRFESSSTRAILLYNAAMMNSSAGDVDRAIELFLRALELTRENKMQKNEARILQGLGFAYWARGDTAQATALLAESLNLRRTLDDAYGLTASLGLVGALAREAGDIQKAFALHREVVSLAASADAQVIGLLDLALDYQAASDYPQAIANARKALSVHVGIPRFYRRYAVQLALADMLLMQPHRTPQAVREAGLFTQDSLNAAILRADTTQEIAARRLLAQSHAARGSFVEARKEYESAIALIFKYRSTINNPALRTIALTHEQKTFRGYVDLLMRDVVRRGPGKLLPVSTDEANALRTLEWARATNFDSARVSSLDPATQARLDELLAQMAGKRVRIAALLDVTDDVTRELEVLRLDMARLRAEVDQLRAAASRDARNADASTTVDAPWPAMSPDTIQLSYALETEHAYLWVRDASGIRASVLSATPAAISRDVVALAAAMRAREPGRLDAVLARLSIELLPSDTLDRDSRALEIVAESKAAAIPFAGLISSGANPRRLAESHSIVMIGSMFAARARREPAQSHPWGLVALASDARTKGSASSLLVFPALSNAGTEARAIAAQFQSRDPPAKVKLLLGAEGTAAHLAQTWRGGVDVLHLATHGLADLRQPLASLLLLPALDADGASTYLTAGQVQEWRGDADLVYLSACETAVGPGRFAEGLSGLQGAFLRAGARGVIATLWPVEDVYASQFATDFYRRYTAGMPASQALSETQREWMQPAKEIRERDLPYRRMTAWAHVFYAQ